MPTYEYRCNGCKREFEIQQKMSDPDLVHCDECGEDKLEKLISWTSVRSNSWEAALSSPNPKEAMKGMHVVDRSRPPKKEAATPPVTPAPPVTPPPPVTPAPPVTSLASAEHEDDEDDENGETDANDPQPPTS
jgi:putative FmdB family regulatory protein